MTTDQIAAIVAAATERAGWQAVDDFWVKDSQLPDGKDGIAMSLDGHTTWIAKAPRTIIALVERVRELEADNERFKEQARFADKRAAKYEAQMDYVESRNVLLGEWMDGNILPSKAAFYPVLAPAIGYYNQELKAWLVNLTVQDAAFWKDTPADYPEDSTLLPKP